MNCVSLKPRDLLTHNTLSAGLFAGDFFQCDNFFSGES